VRRKTRREETQRHNSEQVVKGDPVVAGAFHGGGGQRTVKVSILHEKGDLIAHAITRISNELHHKPRLARGTST
jgi:hypothetical protein